MRKILLAFLAGVVFASGCGRPLTAPACERVAGTLLVRDALGGVVDTVVVSVAVRCD